ncbi:PREDICTED: epithelial cell-transforming sequence 2 oncogene-like [Nanorana parkeri]|uniref:epithelial cell-transforming sequence 2 oncogene-like n=1 Tax=Nanorana parkeri TaxID=125878 RepID=UPI00085471DE|nr:PREDICTED: epithelial cell-transforming sequence 2 oncogene-like [Nanorana parkeri]
MSIKDNIHFDQTVGTQIRFSAWTPMASKSFNKQLFHERVNLIGHWYDLWTDKQRKQFLHSILSRSSRSQLTFIQDWFAEECPVTNVDFTTVIPRVLSLYIFSFLNAHDLCVAGQVSWHWKFLAEQDCLWMPKCTKFGWFLPYTPADNEYGAWKRHYISCACSLDYLTPREAAETYGTLNEPKEGEEELKDKLQETWLRKMLRERLSLQKKELFKSRPPWMSGAWRSAVNSKLSLTQSMSLTDRASMQAALWLIKGKDTGPDKTLTSWLLNEDNHTPSFTLALEKKLVEQSIDSLPKRHNVAGCTTYPSTNTKQYNSFRGQPAQLCTSGPLHLVLISSHILAYEVVLSCVKPGVVPIVYDFNGMTLESLNFCVEKALGGRTAHSIGVVADGNSQHLHLLQGVRIDTQNVLCSHIREFWEKLSSCVVSDKDGGHIDLFVPFAASDSGMEILDNLSRLAGIMFCSPTGIATGSYQHIFSEWLMTSGRRKFPPFLYFTEVKLQAWCRLASVMEEALHMVRKQMKLYLSDLQRNVSGRIIGQFMFDTMSMVKVQTNQDIADALTEALVELVKEKRDDPLEFLSIFLLKKIGKNKEFRNHLFQANTEDTLSAFLKHEDNDGDAISEKAAISPSRSESRFRQLSMLDNKLLVDVGDKRSRFAQELLESERQYVQVLEIIRDIYAAPLKSALSSNRAILSISNMQIIFSDIVNILQINKQLLNELIDRLQEWGPAQCLGDVFMKFGSKLKIYTNFFNNYTVILKTIDKCREATPTFRAFLKRHDQTVVTKMMSLQELLLFPAARFEEYVNLLYALRLHTPPEHPDRNDLSTAITEMKQYKDFILRVKSTLEKDTELTHLQKTIRGCPNLIEANRHLICKQDVALLKSANEDISASLRIYEHISDLCLFLFNDALVISSCHISYTPFKHVPSTSYQFMASVSLGRLLVEDIPDTKYVKNAFVLQGPKRRWICFTQTEEEKVTWLSACQRAIHASIETK